MESISKDLLHCKICIRVLYEPFVNPCGHTFCYSCLSQWFDNSLDGRKFTCPECRDSIAHVPAPNYLIRQIVHKLITQPSFSEDGESPKSHQAAQIEEAAIVERDRQAPEGLFGGRFKSGLRRLPLPRIRDVEDGVDRCPHCTWELEDDDEVCYRCGFELGEEDDNEDFTDDPDRATDLGYDSVIDEAAAYFDDDGDFDLDAELAADLGIPESLQQHHMPLSHSLGFHPARSIPLLDGHRPYNDDSDSEANTSDHDMDFGADEDEDQADDDEDDDDETSMEGFIENDDEGSVSISASRSSSLAPGSEADDGDDDASGTGSEGTESAMPLTRPHPVTLNGPKRRRQTHPVVLDASDDESDSDDEPVLPQRRRLRRPGLTAG